MAKADIGSKWLIGQSPEAWVHWALKKPDLIVEEQLSTEFQYINRLSDSLLRVRDESGPFLVLTELQLRLDPRMPRRIRAYAGLAEEKYDLLVYPIVFYLLPPSSGQDLLDHYHSELMGMIAHQDFEVIKAWELEAEDILRQQNLALLPFVPLMGGANEDVIRRGVQLLRALPDGEALETILGLFASFVLDIETIQQIVRWDMSVLRESPWYQEILQEGLEQGILKGRREDILNLLRVRFELAVEDETEIADRLEQVQSTELLQTLVVAAAQVESLATFRNILDKEVPSISSSQKE